jgi:hypothetical protein
MITPRVLAASVLLAVAPLLASCGGDDESSSPSTTEASSPSTAESSSPSTTEAAGTESTTTSGDVPATTAAPTGGGDNEFCAVSERLDAVFAGDIQPGASLTEEQIAIIEETKAAAPDEISDAVATVLDTYQERGLDESLFTDPEFTGALQEVTEYLDANC